jgi:hypothetical protein
VHTLPLPPFLPLILSRSLASARPFSLAHASARVLALSLYLSTSLFSAHDRPQLFIRVSINRTILLFHTISARPSKQPRMVGSILGVQPSSSVFVRAWSFSKRVQKFPARAFSPPCRCLWVLVDWNLAWPAKDFAQRQCGVEVTELSTSKQHSLSESNATRRSAEPVLCMSMPVRAGKQGAQKLHMHRSVGNPTHI